LRDFKKTTSSIFLFLWLSMPFYEDVSFLQQKMPGAGIY